MFDAIADRTTQIEAAHDSDDPEVRASVNTVVSSASTRSALEKLGESLDR